MERLEQHACFGGTQEVWVHDAASTSCRMRVGVFLPPGEGPFPVLYFLSGLTCTEQNAMTKAGLQRTAAEQGLILVFPDTSPRGPDIPDDASYDLGQGAGFYVDATQAPWSTHFQMQTYIAHELPQLIEARFPATDRRGITGHSMGGHGAMVTALRHPGRYQSVSAISPIVAPSQVPWGHKALGAYLGPDRATWAGWDTVALIPEADERLPLLVDQGGSDGFLTEQLQPERLRAACEAAGHPLTLRIHDGYDHSYYFIATVAEDHVQHHARALLG